MGVYQDLRKTVIGQTASDERMAYSLGVPRRLNKTNET